MDFVTCRLVISLFHQSLYKRCRLILIWLFIYIGYMYIYWIYIYNFQYLSLALSLIVAIVWNMLNVFDCIVDATNTLEETHIHYNDVIMSAMASQIAGVSIASSTICLGTGQRRRQSSASAAFAGGNHRSPVDSPHKWPVRGKFSHLMASSCSTVNSRILFQYIL